MRDWLRLETVRWGIVEGINCGNAWRPGAGVRDQEVKDAMALGALGHRPVESEARFSAMTLVFAA
jgi:hypothetical protein